MALPRFYSATDKLVNAFIMGTIEHEKCHRCAIGTLCDGEDWDGILNGSSGYAIHEVANIECAFEGNQVAMLEDKATLKFRTIEKWEDEDSFIGLCRVFNYLQTIEDWTEEQKGANIFELLETLN